MVDRFLARFGEEIAVLHSKLSIGERHDEWERIRQGNAKIVIGARSAIFAPVENLGLIIIDEEHDSSYKSEASPKYDAKEVAKQVQSGNCEQGILICRSGIGMCIAANKFKGIRCTLCHDEFTAKYSKLHNNGNILAIGADTVTVNEAICILRMWIATEFEGGRHEERIKIIDEIEKENMK